MKMFMDLVGMFNDSVDLHIDDKKGDGVSLGLIFGKKNQQDSSDDDDDDDDDDDEDDTEYDSKNKKKTIKD